MIIVRAILVMAGMLALGMAPALAEQDSCSQVLAANLGNRTDVTQTSGLGAAEKHFRCQQLKNGHSSQDKLSGGLGYGAFAGNLSTGSGSASNQESSDCGDDSAEKHESAFLFYSQLMYSDSIKAWKDCMTSRTEELLCWAEPLGRNRVMLKAFWGIRGAPPTINDAEVTVGDKTINTRFKSKQKLFLGENQISVSRLPNEEITLSLEASADGIGAKTCMAWVPPFEDLKITRERSPRTVPAHTDAEWSEQVDRPRILPGACPCLGYRVDRENQKLELMNSCPGEVGLVIQAENEPPRGVPDFLPLPGRKFISQNLNAGASLSAAADGIDHVMLFSTFCPVPLIPPHPQGTISPMPGQ